MTRCSDDIPRFTTYWIVMTYSVLFVNPLLDFWSTYRLTLYLRPRLIAIADQKSAMMNYL